MKMSFTIAALAGLAVAGTANANIINAGNLFLDGFGATSGPLAGNSALGVTGVTLRADALATGGFAFQSDMEMRVQGPGGLDVAWGPNFSTPVTNIVWPSGANPTAPQDSGNAQQVLITLDFPGGPAPAGAYTVTFTNGYQFNIGGDSLSWNATTVVLEVIPAPASMALLGLGGLVAGRRRR